MTISIRTGLPPLPQRMAALPIDERGYPVPWFVAWVDGKPDHRIMDGAKKLPLALRDNLCWMCGQPHTSVRRTFCIGPMCCITRTISEPPSHIECLRFAVRACPFLSRPKAHRRDANLPDGIREPAGVGLLRNPGAVCLWTTKRYRAYRTSHGNVGVLIELGDAEAIEWYAEGRPATRAEIDESVRTGLPLLEAEAAADDAHNARLPDPFKQRQPSAAQAELRRRVVAFDAMLDRYFGVAEERWRAAQGDEYGSY